MKLTNYLAILLTILLSVSACRTPPNSQTSHEYIITQYGAIGDGKTLNTQAIQETIDYVSENGGGTIVIPKGVFLCGAIFFKPNTHLLIQEGGTLKGSENIDDYPVRASRMEGQLLDYHPALVNAYDLEGFSIEGPGTIDGNGLTYWETFWQHREEKESQGVPWTNLEVRRPRLVFIWNCNDVTIQNVKLHNSGFWTTHLYQCSDVKIYGVDIRAPMEPVPAPSSDAIDLDVCENVHIKDCYLAVNDDAIAIKGGKGPYADEQPENGPITNVLIEDCTFGPSHGAVTLGSECIHANDITIRNCFSESNAPLLRLKLRPDTPQLYENITLENITGSCIELISVKPWTQFFDLQGRETPPQSVVRNITFKNIDMRCASLGLVNGNEGDLIENIRFEDVTISDTDSMSMVLSRPPGFNFDSTGNLDFNRVQIKDTVHFTTNHPAAFEFINVKINGEPFKLEQ